MLSSVSLIYTQLCLFWMFSLRSLSQVLKSGSHFFFAKYGSGPWHPNISTTSWALADHHAEDTMEVFILEPSREWIGILGLRHLATGNMSVWSLISENTQRGSTPSQLPAPSHSRLLGSAVPGTPLRTESRKRKESCHTWHTVAFTVLKINSVISSGQKMGPSLSYTISTDSWAKVCQRWTGQGDYWRLFSFCSLFHNPLLKIQMATHMNDSKILISSYKISNRLFTLSVSVSWHECSSDYLHFTNLS